MSHADHASAEDLDRHQSEVAPGEEFAEEDIGKGIRGYLIGLALATLLTVCSFAIALVRDVSPPLAAA